MSRLALLFASVLVVVPVSAQSDPVGAQGVPADTSETASDAVATVPRRPGVETLPLRTVREWAALAPGLRRDLATGALAVRSRSGEPVFVVDGVRQLEGPGLPFESVGRVGVQTEGVSARYGEAAGGLVVVETEAGGERLGGQAEAFSSRLTDAYDRALGALSVRGPLGRLGGFMLSAEAGRAGDAMPIGGPGALVLTDESQARLTESPQSVVVIDDGVRQYLPFPGEAARVAFEAGERYSDADLRAALGLSADAQILGLVSTLGAADLDFERQTARDAPLDEMRLAGTLDLTPLDGLRVRLGGRLGTLALGDASSPASQAFFRFSPGTGYESEASDQAAWLCAEHDLSPAFGYWLSASAETIQETIHPRGFSADVADALHYGDLDSPRSSIIRQYAQRSSGGFEPFARSDGQVSTLRSEAGLFALPGAQVGTYRRRQDQTAQLGGGLVLRLGRARLDLGAEAERQTHRQFVLSGFSLAQYFADGSGVRAAGGIPSTGVQSYDQLSYQALRPLVRYYGYTFNGLGETDRGASIDDRVTITDGVPVSTASAPFQPTTVAGFAEGSGQIGPLAVRVGMRVETYNRGGQTLLDPYANLPVERAGSLSRRPEGVGEDFAVYFRGGVAGDQNVVGFRDLDGVVYDAQGQRIPVRDLVGRNAFLVIDRDLPISTAFAESPTHAAVQPRVALRLDVSPALAVLASYDRLSRRPPPDVYSTVVDYIGATSGSRVTDPGLRPETLDAARLGAEATLTPTVQMSAALFHRRSSDEFALRGLEGGLTNYTLFTNAGATRETGADLGLVWVPSDALAATASYTLAVAESDTLLEGFVFREGPPEISIPAFDGARHEIDAVVAFRMPTRLGGVGVGMTLSAQSGLPYTPASALTEFNEARLPWTSQLDLRLGKEVRVAGAAVEVFGWVENLLGTDNVLAVYRATGRPDTDGVLDSFNGRPPSTPAERLLYQSYLDGPVNVGGDQSTSHPFFYGQPRQIRLGVRATL